MEKSRRNKMMVRFTIFSIPFVGMGMLIGIVILGHIPRYPLTEDIALIPNFMKSYLWTILLGFVPALGVYIYSFKSSDSRYAFWGFAIPGLIFNLSPWIGTLPGLILISTLAATVFFITKIPWLVGRLGTALDNLYSWIMVDK